MMSENSRRVFVERLRAGLDPHVKEPVVKPATVHVHVPVRQVDGYEVQEHQSMVQLSSEDQELLIALRQRHENFKERNQPPVCSFKDLLK